MTARSGDPHAIEEELESTAGYQAAPREDEREGEEPATFEDGQPIDPDLLEEQRDEGVQSPGAGCDRSEHGAGDCLGSRRAVGRARRGATGGDDVTPRRQGSAVRG